MKLKDKISIISGGARGIGRAIAEIFCKEGCLAIIVDLNKKLLEQTINNFIDQGFNAAKYCCDISDIIAVRDTVKRIINKYKKIDILVNNAGLFSSVPLLEMTEKEWDKVMDVNLKGTFFFSQEIFRVMIQQKQGKIINITSLSAKRGGTTSGVNYGASKAGIVSLTKYFAKYGASDGINVNAIVPGFVETEMNPNKANVVDSIPLGRMATPEEIAKVALFLASDDSNYITGEMIDVDGGIMMD